MTVINVHEAKTTLSALLERVSQGERLVIGKSGRPIARLEPFNETNAVHRPFKGGNLRLQEKSVHKLTPEYVKKIAASKYDD